MKSRQVDDLDEIVRRYNLTWKRSTNRSPMRLFRSRSGYNLRTADIEEPAENSNVDFNALLEEPTENSDVDFDAFLEEQELNQLSSTEDNDVGARLPNPSEKAELYAYRQRYQVRMIEDASANYRRLGFEVGALVLIKRAFDNNTRTRKEKNTPFYEDGVWRVTGLNGPNC
jgi:hypothetical protein